MYLIIIIILLFFWILFSIAIGSISFKLINDKMYRKINLIFLIIFVLLFLWTVKNIIWVVNIYCGG